MILEEGTKLLVAVGVILTLGIYLGFVLILYLRTKNKGLLWFTPQSLMLGLGLYFFNRLIDNHLTVPTAILSEENTLMLGLMVLSFIISMIFMIIGILRILKNERKILRRI